MALSDQITQTLADYVAGNIAKPSWLDAMRNTEEFGRLWSMVNAQRQALAQGMADPAEYINSARANLGAVVNQVLPGDTAAQYGFGAALAAAAQRPLPDALPGDPERPINYLDPRNTIPDFQGPAPDLPQPTGAAAGGFQPTIAQRDAFADIQAQLSAWNLGAESDWLWDEIKNNRSPNEILLDLQKRPTYVQEFGQYQDEQRKNGWHVMTPKEVLDYRAAYNQTMQEAGMAGVLGGNDNANDQLKRNRSINELRDLINVQYNKVRLAPPEVRTAWKSFFGVEGDAALAAFYLHSDKTAPELERMAEVANIAGVGARYGIGVGQPKAEQIAQFGYSEGQIEQGFRQLDQLQPLFQETISETKDLTAEDTGIQEVFGTGPNKRETEKRLEERNAAFSGGGGAFATQQGFRGLGSARTN